MMEACIFNIQRYSLHDGGGIRTIVFFKGCHCQCPWCCNPESLQITPQVFYKEILCMNCTKKVDGKCYNKVEDCPTGAKSIVGEMKSIDSIMDIVKRDRVFYETSKGGVTLSGGEVLLQQEVALQLLEQCKNEHIHTAIESTLSLEIQNIERLVALVDVFLVDFKIMDEKKSKDILHLDVQRMISNVREIRKLNGHVVARIPLIPSYTSDSDNLTQIMKQLKELDIKEVHILPFHQLGANKYKSIEHAYTCENLKALSDDEVETIKQLFMKQGFHTNVHGA